MSDVESAILRCESCGVLGVHTIRYAGRLIVETRCEACAATVTRDPAMAGAQYLRDLEQRLQSKPRRLIRRAIRDPGGFVTTLPAKVISQPLKLARELRTLRATARGSDPSGPTDES